MACDGFSGVLINTSVDELGTYITRLLPTFFIFQKKKGVSKTQILQAHAPFIHWCCKDTSIYDQKQANSVCTPSSCGPHRADWFMYRKGLFQIGQRISMHETLFSIKKKSVHAQSPASKQLQSPEWAISSEQATPGLQHTCNLQQAVLESNLLHKTILFQTRSLSGRFVICERTKHIEVQVHIKWEMC